MTRIAFDMSSLIWTCLLAGKDVEAKKVEHNGRLIPVNTAAYGYENSVNSVVSTLKNCGLVPRNMIMVFEGIDSKAPRLAIANTYKAKRGNRPMEAYAEFQKLSDKLKEVFGSLGACCVTQDRAEGDDTLAYLAINSEEDLYISTNDGDMTVLNGVNKYGAKITVLINGIVGENKYGDFPAQFVTVYKALVGDTSDSISGIKGFGEVAWTDFFKEFGVAGLAELDRMAKLESLDDLVDELDNKMVAKIYAGKDDFLLSYKLAKMYPEWVNTLHHPLKFQPGLIKGVVNDERLVGWSGKATLVTTSNYKECYDNLQRHLDDTEFFSLDLETSVDELSEEWLESRSKGKGVDVIGSRITGGSISFGNNLQYAYYMTVDHVDSDNITLDQFADMLSLVPKDKLTVAHNAAGFELPVMYNELGEIWKDNGWRGFYPNMVDSRIAASFWNENVDSHGLKQLSKLLFNYEQESYDAVTGGLRMNQIPATKVLHYGCDDVYVSGALWDFFTLFMQLEHTYDAFLKLEQKPMYLQALSYCQGIRMDMAKLAELSQADDKKETELQVCIDKYLVDKGWSGTVLPVVEEITPANIKDAVRLCGAELDTMVRKLDRIAPLVETLGFDGAKTLAGLIRENSVTGFNAFIAQRWTAKPVLNTGSPKQISDLLYTTMEAPVRLRNKPTPVMRAKGIREGSARTDDDAMNMAIKRGDVTGSTAEVLKALIEVKSIGTRRGLYWSAYPKFLHHKTGKLHPELRQSATNTRRYTGNSPNLQQMESSYGGVRSVILGHHRNAIVVSLDESGQEVRQMADYAKDENLLTCYLGTKDQLRDVHSIVASKIAGCTYEEFRYLLKKGTPEEQLDAAAKRQKAKVVLFGSLYGAAAPKIAEGLGIEEEEAQSYIDAIYAMFPKVKEWKDGVEQFALSNGYVNIHGGTIRHLRELVTSEDKYIASKAMRQAGNASIQAAGGNQIKRVMGRIWDSDLLDNYDYRWYFSVHDESLHSISREHCVEVVRVLHGFMTEQFLEIVPSASSIGVGLNFGELQELPEEFDPVLLQETVDKLFLV